MAKRNFATILGVGNLLLRDEGFGVHFVKWLSGRYPNFGNIREDIRIVDGGTLGYALLDIICSCEHLIVIDVIKVNDIPGSIYRFTRDEMETHMPPPTSAHEVSFPDVLFKAELLDESPETVFLCIVPEDYGEMGMELTEPMLAKFPAMEKLLIKELSRLGVRLENAANA